MADLIVARVDEFPEAAPPIATRGQLTIRVFKGNMSH